MLKRAYARGANIVAKSRMELFADVTLLIASSYLVLKRTTDFAISEWLLENYLQPPAVKAYLVVAGAFLIAAVICKIACLVVKALPISTFSAVEPERIAGCIRVINNEVSSHLDRCDSIRPLTVDSLSDEHAFGVNMRSIVESLVEHIRSTVDADIRRRDLFASVYTLDEDARVLRYELHFNDRSDAVKSRIISLDDREFENYECVKCLTSSNSTSYVTNKSGYEKGEPRRYKTMRQYMGCRLEHGDRIFGFLSVEFHRVSPFSEEKEMAQFMEEHVFPFKLLLEYQYLKGKFFRRFSEIVPAQRAS